MDLLSKRKITDVDSTGKRLSIGDFVILLRYRIYGRIVGSQIEEIDNNKKVTFLVIKPYEQHHSEYIYEYAYTLQKLPQDRSKREQFLMLRKLENS